MSRSTYVMTMIESLCASLTSVRARDRQPGTMGDRVLSRSTYVPDPRVSTTCRWGGGCTVDFVRSGVIRGLQRPLDFIQEASALFGEASAALAQPLRYPAVSRGR